jgi:hypothetical protein
MANQLTDDVLNRLTRGIDIAQQVAPEQYKGLTFVVIVAEPKSGSLSWACSHSVDLGVKLMLDLVEAETEKMGETLQ